MGHQAQIVFNQSVACLHIPFFDALQALLFLCCGQWLWKGTVIGDVKCEVK